MTCPSCGSYLEEADAAYCGICGARARPRRTTLTGAVLDERYHIESKIAEGGFGSIYRATHIASGLDVALKILHADLAVDPSLATRFRREMACLERLHDPHTVATYETGEAPDGTLYIAMELLVGESLHDRMSRGRIGWRTALSIVRDACSSLAEAHELGIVHRDLKPANLHLGANDIVKVLDFGIARIATSELDDGAELTRMGQMIGTLEYMAPEQVLGGACDSRSDIYQLGVLTYEMITGRRPFAGSSNPTSLITALLTQSPPAPSTMFCGGCLPQEVDHLILRCLEREPELRFASVHRLVDAIDAALLLGDAHPAMHVDADDEAPTWIAASHSTSAAMAPARTAIIPSVDPAIVAAFEMQSAMLSNPPLATPTPDRNPPREFPSGERRAKEFPSGERRAKEFPSGERRLASGTTSPVGEDSALQFAPTGSQSAIPAPDLGSHSAPRTPSAHDGLVYPRAPSRRPDARSSFRTRVALWAAGLVVGGVAVGAVIASLLG